MKKKIEPRANLTSTRSRIYNKSTFLLALKIYVTYKTKKKCYYFQSIYLDIIIRARCRCVITRGGYDLFIDDFYKKKKIIELISFNQKPFLTTFIKKNTLNKKIQNKTHAHTPEINDAQTTGKKN